MVLAWIIQQTNKRAILTAKHMKPQIARIGRIKPEIGEYG